MIADVLRRPRLLSWRLPSLDDSAPRLEMAEDLPAISDPRDGLPRVIAVLSAVVIPVVALTSASEVGAGFAYRDVIALLIAYAVATVVLVRVPWSRIARAWSGALIGYQLLFVVSLTTLTGGGGSPYFALYAAILAIAGWHLAAGPFLGVVASVAVIEVWRALTVDGTQTFEQVTIGLPFFGAVGLLALFTARRLTAVLVILRQDQARTSATLTAVRDLTGDPGADPLPGLAAAAETVFGGRATAIAMTPTFEHDRGVVIIRSGGRQLTIAISGADSAYGLLQLERDLPYTSTERRLAAILADTAGRALDGHRLFDEVRQASERDALTGLLNRRCLESDLTHLVGPAINAGQAVTLAFADINGLKSINDEHGHEVGDRVIRRAARVLSAVVRHEDRVYRAGGDEFVVLAIGLSPAESAILGDRLREATSKPARRAEDAYQIPITLSIGVAIGSGPGSSPDDLLAEADRAMYRTRTTRSTGPVRPQAH